MPLPEGARLRRTMPQRLLLVFNCLMVVSCFGAAAALAYVDTKIGQIQRISLRSTLSPAAEQTDVAQAPRNILIVGVDSVDGLDEDDPRMQGRDGGLRSDTMMLLRLDPALGTAHLVAFPRDLWLRIGGDGGFDRLNAALPIGGADLLIETISKNFDLDIHHYVQVNFAQFQDLVDVIGGVPVPFRTPARDTWTGLNVVEPSCVVFDGEHALDYVRSRHLQLYENGRWSEDPYADLSRIRRQQDFIKRAIDRAVERGLRNPITMNRLIDVGLDSVTVDHALGVDQILSLANRFSRFDSKVLTTHALPVASDTTSGGASILRLITADAEPIFDIFRGGAADPESPESVDVDVYLGTSGPRARSAAEDLSGVGFAVGERGTQAGGPVLNTAVRFRPSDRVAAELLVRWLDGDVVLSEDRFLDAAGIVLSVGEDFAGVRDVARPVTTTSAPSAGPPSTVAQTTTTQVGFLPPEGAEHLCD